MIRLLTAIMRRTEDRRGLVRIGDSKDRKKVLHLNIMAITGIIYVDPTFGVPITTSVWHERNEGHPHSALEDCM